MASQSSWMLRLFDPKTNWLAAAHRRVVGNRLRKVGLRYEDLFDHASDLDVREAVHRLPREVVNARNERLKRAMDLSMKHHELPPDLQAMQTPFRSYLLDMLNLVQKDNEERRALGALPLYERTFP